MTLSNRCKEVGLTVTELSKMTGRERSTLRAWFLNSPEFFDIVLAGAVVIKQKSTEGANG